MLLDLTVNVNAVDFDQAAATCLPARDHDWGHGGPAMHVPACGWVELSASPRVMLYGNAAALRRLAELATRAAELTETSDAHDQARHPTGPEPTNLDAGAAGAAGTVEGVGR